MELHRTEDDFGYGCFLGELAFFHLGKCTVALSPKAAHVTLDSIHDGEGIEFHLASTEASAGTTPIRRCSFVHDTVCGVVQGDSDGHQQHVANPSSVESFVVLSHSQQSPPLISKRKRKRSQSDSNQTSPRNRSSLVQLSSGSSISANANGSPPQSPMGEKEDLAIDPSSLFTSTNAIQNLELHRAHSAFTALRFDGRRRDSAAVWFDPDSIDVIEERQFGLFLGHLTGASVTKWIGTLSTAAKNDIEAWIDICRKRCNLQPQDGSPIPVRSSVSYAENSERYVQLRNKVVCCSTASSVFIKHSTLLSVMNEDSPHTPDSHSHLFVTSSQAAMLFHAFTTRWGILNVGMRLAPPAFLVVPDPVVKGEEPHSGGILNAAFRCGLDWGEAAARRGQSAAECQSDFASAIVNASCKSIMPLARECTDVLCFLATRTTETTDASQQNVEEHAAAADKSVPVVAGESSSSSPLSVISHFCHVAELRIMCLVSAAVTISAESLSLTLSSMGGVS